MLNDDVKNEKQRLCSCPVFNKKNNEKKKKQ